jgi:membrane associated rhomboid family serine protease
MFPLTDGMRPSRFAIVNVSIIAACFIVWIFLELPHLNAAVRDASFYACDVDGSCDSSLPWTVSWFTAMFMHASWGHIIGNMWFLAIFGKMVEDSFGRLQFLGFYIAGGLAAATLQAAMTLIAGTAADASVPMLGASGAIAAVLGAYWVLYPGARILTILGIFPVRIPAWVFLGGWFVYQFIAANRGLLSAGGDDGGTAFFAHVGGFAFGVVVAVALVRSGRREGRFGGLQPAGG